ncbi:hypothetical protein AVEN_17646-1 [Araneus ventricosus]|uniref:Uncharacterized protein n=1 Tax=Araneus ventricosus TaxID=182803 RepID=A0A4Y2VWW0_ARAVE|nr:hypothetical protein AVEN_17646-1 [Araneus ventricosus]
MESRCPAMGVLWLGREFYRDKYGMTSSSHVWFLDLGDKLGHHLGDFGDEIWDLKGAGIFSIFPLGEKIRLNAHVTSLPAGGNYIRRALGVLFDWVRLGTRTSFEFVRSAS